MCFEDWIRVNGLHTSPYNCQLVLDAMTSLNQRMVQHNDNTRNVLEKLQQTKLRVCHPALTVHPSHDCVRSSFTPNRQWISVFTITSFTTKNKILTAMINCKHIVHRTSFGNPESRTDSPPWPQSNNVNGNNTVTWRISIGYENDVDQVILGIKNICSNV